MQTSSLVGPFSSGTMRNRPTSSFHHSQQDENPIQQNIYSTTSNTTTTSSKYRSQHQTKPNRWILAIIIGIPILLLVLFYWEFSKTENVEWDDVKEDMHVPQQAVLSELSQEDSIRNRKRSKLAIITYAQSDAHMDWLKKEYFAHLEEMRQSRTIVYISVCENIRNNLDLSDFTNNENRDVIKISFSKSCHIPSLISNGMKFSKKLSEFMMVLDPGFSIYVNDELNAPHSQTIVKKRIDDLLGESDESKQLFREHVDYGLLVVNVIDSSETPSTTFNLHIPKERAKNRLWVSKLLPLYSQEQRKSISQFYEQWDQSNALYVPFSENYDRDTILSTPASHFFIFATTSPEDNNYNLKNDEIIDHVVEGLERHISENSYQNSFNMIESRQVLSNLILSQILDRYEHLKEKLNPPPIYFLPKPFVIEWKPSHNVLHESTELLHNGLSFATYCRIDEIESLNGLIKRLSDGDHLIVIFTANSPKQCMSTELQQFINSPKKARLDYKCIVVKKKDSIPINHFKNQALLLAKTKWIFILDVQSRVSKNLNRDFTKVFIADSSSRPLEKLEPLSQHSESLYWKSPIEHMKKYSNLAQFLELEKIVFIPPSFEQIEMEEELPTDFTSLKKVYQKRMLSVVDAQQVDFSNYFAVSSQGQKAYQAKPYYPFNSLFIAAVTHLPLYDEYSYQSLAVHHVHLTMRYFQYFVLPRHFVIGYVSESPRKRTKPKQPQFELVLKKMSGFYSNERINMVKKDQH